MSAITKTETLIIKALEQDLSWMETPHTMITSPSFSLTKGSILILGVNRDEVWVNGKVACRIAKRMIAEGRIDGRIVDFDRVAITLDDEKKKIAQSFGKEDLIPTIVYSDRCPSGYTKWVKRSELT